jgi:hypothetical protein
LQALARMSDQNLKSHPRLFYLQLQQAAEILFDAVLGVEIDVA